MRIIPRGGGIARPITLTTRLDPHEGIEKRVAGVCGWAHAKAGVYYVAPVAPGLLAGWLFSVAAFFVHTELA
jgi:hypothetical protein